MMKEKLYLLCLLILIGCKTPSQYFSRPKVLPTINNEGTGFRDGVEIDTTNFICVDPKEYEVLQDYYDDKEYRLFLCLKFNRCN